jgi:uncharacterized coiled-coil protein SlyX
MTSNAALEAAVGEQAAVIERLQAAVAEKDIGADGLRKTLLALGARIEEKDAALGGMKAENERLSAEIARLRDKVSVLSGLIKSANIGTCSEKGQQEDKG